MNFRDKQLWINDYLDLYLYAKNLNDQLWQQEIIEKLKYSQIEFRQKAQFIKSNNQLNKHKQ